MHQQFDLVHVETAVTVLFCREDESRWQYDFTGFRWTYTDDKREKLPCIPKQFLEDASYNVLSVTGQYPVVGSMMTDYSGEF